MGSPNCLRSSSPRIIAIFWTLTVVIGLSLCEATLGPNSYTTSNNDHKQNNNKPHEQSSTLHSSSSGFQHHHGLKRNKNCPKTVFIVSTMDGKVQALDVRNKGQKLWSVQADTQPLLSSSISKLELTKDGVSMRLIPALDGSLYQYDGDNLEALPVSSETLLSSTFRINDDTMMIGGKAIRNYGVDMVSGQLRYACSMSGCQRFGHTDTNADEEELIVITRNTQTVRAVDSRNGMERWNFSVGNHQVNYVGSMPNKMMEPSDEDDVAIESENDDEPSCPAETGDMKESSMKVVIPEGVVFYVNPDDPNQILWQQKLSSPIASAWLFDHNRLKPISLFSRVHIPTISGQINPIMYIGNHQNQMYVQVSHHVTNQIIDGGTGGGGGSPLGKVPSVYWKPYLASSCSRTPTLRPNKNNGVPLIGRKTFKRKDLQNTAVAVWQQSYPFDDGYYLFPDFTPSLPDKDKETGEDYKSIFENVRPSSLMMWWKEVAFISIITAVVFNLVVFCCARFEASKKEHSDDSLPNITNPPEQDEAKIEEELLALSKTKEPEVERPDSLSLTTGYISKYSTDFDHIKRLNHGAYGVVFMSKNKFDSCSYAVKRICLPKSSESEEKVMREVTTLANLDHVGIVRYFQSWFECPPSGWQEKIDKEMGFSDAITPSVTTQNTSPTESFIPHPVNIGGGCLKHNPLRAFNHFDFPAPKINGFSSGKFADEDESGSFSMNEPISPPQTSSSEDDDDAAADDEDDDDESDTVPFGKYTEELKTDDSKTDDSMSIIFKDSGVEKGEQAVSLSSNRLHSSRDSTSGMLVKEMCEKKSKPSENFEWKNRPKMYLYIQMQLCKQETLKDWLNKHTEQRNCEEVLDFFDQIVTAVEYVHKKGVLHRDLKPSNIFFSMEDVIKVGDFGLATAMKNILDSGEEEDEEEINGQKVCLSGSTVVSTQYKRHTGGVGTELYMSPELLDGKPYNQKVDIFALGMILFELLYPFKTETERRLTLTHVKKQKYPQDFSIFIPDLFFDKTIDLLDRLLSPNSDERPSASEILDSDLMTDFAHSKVPRRFRNRTLSSSSGGSSGAQQPRENAIPK